MEAVRRWCEATTPMGRLPTAQARGRRTMDLPMNIRTPAD